MLVSHRASLSLLWTTSCLLPTFAFENKRCEWGRVVLEYTISVKGDFRVYIMDVFKKIHLTVGAGAGTVASRWKAHGMVEELDGRSLDP
jgi:hypothetical protein